MTGAVQQGPKKYPSVNTEAKVTLESTKNLKIPRFFPRSFYPDRGHLNPAAADSIYYSEGLFPLHTNAPSIM